MYRLTVLWLALILLAGCAVNRKVHQEDLDAWIGVPVVALDTHSFMLTLPMVRTVTDSGIEIRVYSNKSGVSSCGGSGFGATNWPQGGSMSYANFNAYQTCASKIIGCDGIFYIREGKVIEVKAVGQCYTDEKSRPEKGYERFLKQ